MANIDVENTLRIMELVVRLSRELGQTFIVATHDHLAARSCTTAYKMRDGTVISKLTGPDVTKALL